MLCRIDDSCFEKGSIKELTCLFSYISLSSGLNSIFVKPKSLKSDSFISLPQSLQNIIKQSLFATVNSSSYRGEIIDVSTEGHLEITKKIFSIQEAIDYVSSPVNVYVENIQNDGYFLNCIIKYFGSARINKALEKNKIVLQHLGGCSSTKAVFSTKEREFKNKIKFFRYYVLWDSDKEFPDDENHKYDQAIIDLSQWNIRYHILDKREAENYLPDDAIQELCGSNNGWFNAFRHLTDVQKDFYDMQCGFKIKNMLRSSYTSEQDPNKMVFCEACDRNFMKEGIKNLYSTLSDANWNFLSKGSGIANFKESFSLQFEKSSHVHRTSLLQRMPRNPNELSSIASELEQIL
ncbi:hypothetical protein SAMN05720487_12317 [Fibrobacter sp. UWT2]|uniref:hypothetical protein n=1 Tax=Fibrobacter sp. UWT2 TaxID=1896224 RepID=UPI00091B9152|nr:hypothetical protein [Fibrobacter sp. UWT2]SHL72004.1 hypothetical protein SAMN05720487_12317 [Fibrobacter sp. UWT2]